MDGMGDHNVICEGGFKCAKKQVVEVTGWVEVPTLVWQKHKWFHKMP